MPHLVLYGFLVFWVLLSVRTALFWMQCWQIREYRPDRMRAFLSTKEGFKTVFNLWFFRGILPRPTVTGRLLGVSVIYVVLSYFLVQFLGIHFGLIVTAILWERLAFLLVGIGVMISSVPVYIAKQRLFAQARKVRDESGDVMIVGITGSYGKSSTREIVTHLLRMKYGEKQVLSTPENQNNEVAIARWVLRHRSFFENKKNLPHFVVVEVGAYKKGEIRTVCEFLRPHVGILTGINAQHVSLFGSQEAIVKAKFELAESVTHKIFFNADSDLLNSVFADSRIKALKIPVRREAAKNVGPQLDRTVFELYGKRMVLPWGGEGFVGNALLAIEVAHEMGLTPVEIMRFLPQLKPLERALAIERQKKTGIILLKDLYSSNPDGVLMAVSHLNRFSGRKIFVGRALLELGDGSAAIHRQIFEAIAKTGAQVYWFKKDYEKIAQEVLGERFRGNNWSELEEDYKNLQKGDVVLLEGKLPKRVMDIFN